MISLSLSPDQDTLLKQIADSGSQGLRLPEARMGDLLALALDDLVDVTPDRKVIATAKGRAFRTRTAA